MRHAARACITAFALWFGFVTAESGLALACIHAAPPAQDATHSHHGDEPSAPEHDTHRNCVSHCLGVAAVGLMPAAAPALSIPVPRTATVQSPATLAEFRSPVSLPYAIGPPHHSA